MNKTAWKIFLYFTLLSAVIATILLFINVLGLAFIGSDSGNVYPNNQRYLLEQISKNMIATDTGIYMADTGIIPDTNWCLVLNEEGDVIWSHNMPDDIPEHYSLNDIARMTRWYLNGYPVYVRTEDYGLLVLGIPRDEVAKYDIQYSLKWFHALPQKLFIIFIGNLFFAFTLAFFFSISLYRTIKVLTTGIKELRQEKNVHLKEKGIFKELAKNINETSESISRKNAALCSRDNARSNWIAGISHDIRTPLSMITGYSEALSKSEELSEENRRTAALITSQSLKIKELIENLNLISSLEYDMQTSRKKEVLLCPLLRGIISEMINNNLKEQNEFRLNLKYEQAAIMGDESLLERAFFNIINNCITHNEEGCIIHISEYKENGNIMIQISDNGSGVPDEVLQHMDVMPKSAHGIGLPMAYRIFYVHGGKMTAKNDNGFCVTITLPI